MMCERGSMRLVRCGAGASFSTTDAVAESLLQYALTSGNYGLRNLVRIPVRLDDGGIGEVVLLLGRDTQLSSEPSASPEDEIDPLVALDLRDREERLHDHAFALPWGVDEALPPA